MKLLLSFGILFLALSFCGLGERISKQISDSSEETTGPDTGNPDVSEAQPGKGDEVEVPKLTAKQEDIIANGKELVWDEQGLTWKLPKGWNKLSQSKKMLNYGSPANGFLIVSISSFAENFPVDISLKAFYDSHIRRAKDGEIEDVRYLEIDGVKGVEFIESMPEDKSDARRHQWIAYRRYNGQVQMLNVIVSTKGSNFESRRDDFKAVMYSMKIGK
ncbi:MAG: hypothetical protein HKN25_16600 [Pyrinomonadaceae bacterium]|nr:hypothetical protein [Pyrinomonadaceae bacterium]